MRHLLFFSFVVLCGVLAKAQPMPPDLQCLSGDTLTWLDPVDACGPLVSISIFASENAAGGYTLFQTVQAGEEEYILNNADAARLNGFYLIGNYNCVPPESLPSDTVTTTPLLVPRIEGIDYDIGGTRLTWNYPDDPRVTGFIVYKETSMGTEILDTVFQSSYVDLLTAVEGAGAIYYLSSIDACNGTSFSPVGYSSLTLNLDRDACVEELRISPVLPTEFPHPFVEVKLVRTSIFGVVDSIVVPFSDSLVVFPDLAPEVSYTVRVSYIDNQGGVNTSFPIDVGSQMVVSDDLVEVVQLSYEDATWAMRWRWNPNALYDDIRWEVRRGGGVVASADVDRGLRDSPAPIVDLGLGADFDWSTAEAVVLATDVCGVTRVSAPAKPGIVQASEVDVFNVFTSWTLPQSPSGNLLDWDLRLLDGVGSVRLLTTDNLTEFTHDVGQVNFREVCYQVVTEVEAPAVFERGRTTFAWRSAPRCALRSPRVYLPTGFVPEGFTIGYRPRISLTEGLDYRFRIYDRWGKALFDTTDPFETWSGRTDGKLVPAGSYLAIVELTEAGRDPIIVETLFALVR